MGGSSSSSAVATSNKTVSKSKSRDARVATDNGGIGVSTSGEVALNIVPDEAFQLGKEALAEISDLARSVTDTGGRATETAQSALAMALERSQQMERSEETQLSEQIIKIGIPAAALAFAVSQIWGK